MQMKPTIVSFVFAAILLTGLLQQRPLFKMLLGQNLHLTAEGWRVLTWLWLFYFVFISGLNEFIWRHYTWEFWAAFKAFGLMPLTVALRAAANAPAAQIPPAGDRAAVRRHTGLTARKITCQTREGAVASTGVSHAGQERRD